MKPYLVILVIILIIGLGIGGYFVVKKYKKTDSNTEGVLQDQPQNTSISTNETTNTSLNKEFTSDSHKLSFNYPSSWKNKETSGEKNVTEPLQREDVANIYDPIAADSDKARATLKLLRFVIEDNKKITSEDDWYNYVKEKVDKFIAQNDLVNEIGYSLISLEKVNDINGHFSVREDYTLNNNVRGRDFYIFSKDIYQFVFECFQNDFNKYSTVLDEIVTSFKINN